MLLIIHVNIFKTAMDVRIKYVYINVRLTVDKGFYFVTQEDGGRCDFYLKIERCLKQHNLENFFVNFSCLEIME